MVSVTFQEKKTLIRAALGQRTEKDDFRFRLDRWQQVVVMSLRVGHNRLHAHMFSEMKLAPSPICNCGLEDQTAEQHTAEIPASADSETKCVAKSSPATHQTLRQQGGTGEGSDLHLADWTLSVVGTSADSTTKCVANSYTPNSTAARRNWKRRPH